MKTDHEILLTAKSNTNRKFFVAMLGVALILLVLNLNNMNWIENGLFVHRFSRISREDLPAGFLVHNSNCQIEDHSPFDKHTMKHFKKQHYTNCAKKPRLAKVTFDKGLKKYVLTINKELRKIHGKDLECCYHKIYRPPYDEDADKRVRFVNLLFEIIRFGILFISV